MPSVYRPTAAFNLYEPPPPEYNPIRGQVVIISELASGRPLLLVERANKHRIRAIINNDDIHSDSVPAIGATVECIQESGLWVYVRTLDIREDHSKVHVRGAGWNIALNRAHLYSTVNNWLGMGSRYMALQTADSSLHIDDSGVEISGAGSGIKVGARIVLDGGLQYADGGTTYRPVVVLPDWDWIITSGASSRSSTATAANHSHGMDHTHDVDHSADMKRVEQLDIDSVMVDADRTALPALTAPDGLSIDGDSRNQRFLYAWNQYQGASALWYNIWGRHGIITDPDAIAAALNGDAISGIADALLATMQPNNFLIVRAPVIPAYADQDRGIGRTRHRRLSDVTTSGRKITQIEIIGFSVQAQVDRPRRFTPWSEPSYIYYVDYEVL